MNAPAPSGRIVRSAPSAAEVARRKRRLKPWLGLVAPAVLLVVWEIGSRLGVVDARFLPRPTRIAAAAIELVDAGTLSTAFIATLKRLVIGTAIGILGGTAVGVALGLSSFARVLLEPLLSALYTVPKLAVLPLLLLIFGAGEAPLVALVAITVFFYMWLAAMQAAIALDPGYQEAATVFGASRWQRLRHVIWPAILPQLVSSIRIAWGVGVLVVVGAEFVNASDGLGALVWHSWSVFLADRMYVGITVISLLGVGGMWLVDAFGAALTPWTPENRGRPARLGWAIAAVLLLAVGLIASAYQRPSAKVAAVDVIERTAAGAFAPQPLDEEARIRVTVPGRMPFVVPILLAESLGEFARENLRVEIVTGLDADSFPLLARGELDVVAGAPTAAFFNAAASGLLLRWVTGLTAAGRANEGIFIRRAVVSDPEFPSWRDLIGRKVGTSQGLGGALSYVIGRHMLEASLDPNEVHYVRLRSPQDIGIALENGSIDAGWISMPMAVEALASPDLSYLGGTQVGDKLAAVFFGPSLLLRNRDAGRAFVRAIARTLDRHLTPGWTSDPEVVQAVATLVDAPADILRLSGPVFDLELPTPRNVRRIQRVLARYPGIMSSPRPLPDDLIVDRHFTDEVYDDDEEDLGDSDRSDPRPRTDG